MKVKSLLISILIGIVAIPTIFFSRSFAVSLIQGKTPSEAIQILAKQFESLIGRIEVVETRQAKQEQIISELQTIANQCEIPTIIPSSEIKISPTEKDLKEKSDRILKLIVPISASEFISSSSK